VWTDQDGAVVTAELPGINPADIDISVQNDTLTLRGKREPDEVREGETYHRRERGSGSFTRLFQLPFQVESNRVEASYAKGILSITLPRAEADKPQKIAIHAPQGWRGKGSQKDRHQDLDNSGIGDWYSPGLVPKTSRIV